MGVYIPYDDYSAMQGPCPDGFHIPTKDECTNIINIGTTLGIWSSSNGAGIMTYLKMPYAGNRAINSNTSSQGSVGYYWSCENDDNTYRWALQFASSYSGVYTFKAIGFSIRPFRDTAVTPDSSRTSLYSDKIYHNSILGLISLSSDGQNWITIADKNLGATTVYNNGDTLSEANCGKYYQWGNNYGFAWTGSVTTSSTQVNASTYGPGNYYSSSTFITTSPRDTSNNDNLRGGVTGVKPMSELKNAYIGEYVPPLITTPGIYHNATLGLISLSSDGSTRITIADKNLGATTVYNNGDTLSAANCGNFYQWGNNYGFPRSGAVNVVQNSDVNASTYGPNNYYSNSTFRGGSNEVYWDTSKNNNLWGGTTDTYTARKGPCNTGWHIPSYNDLIFVSNIAGNSTTDTPPRLKLPPAGSLKRIYGTLEGNGTTYEMWSSDGASGGERGIHWQMGYTITPPSGTFGGPKKAGYSIRPFKNEAVQPDSSWTKLN